MTYTPQLLERFHTISHDGQIAGTKALGAEGNATCGDVVEISLRIEDGTVTDARFRTLGCAIAIAASDAVCELVIGLTTTAAEMLDPAKVTGLLGGVPEERAGCAGAPISAMQSALRSSRAGGTDRVRSGTDGTNSR